MNKPDNYAAFYGLLNRMCSSGKETLKESIVQIYTSGRTTSLREMTLEEYNEALEAMKKYVVPTFAEQLQKLLKKKRSSVLHQMQVMGIDTTDWARVDAYCLDKRIAGKRFRSIDIEGLDALLVKLRTIHRKNNNQLK